MLQLSSVSFSYSSSLPPVIQNLSLTVGNRDFLVLLGTSGCGKSTIIRLCAGLLKQTSGTIEISSSDSRGPGSATVVFQEYDRALLPWRTSLENARLPLEHLNYLSDERRDVAFRALELVGLEQSANKYPQQLSGGMRQRLCIARALVMNPDVLLLDEPFGSLDACTREELRTRVSHIWSQRNIGIVMATHDIDEAILLGTHLALVSPSPKNVVDVVENTISKGMPIEDIRSSQSYIKLWRHVRSFLFGSKP